MKKDMADALLEFYKVILKPELDAIKENQVVHDGKLSETLDHFDSLYHRLGRLEDEYLVMMHGIKRIEDSLGGREVLKRTDLEKRFKDIKEQFSVLQSRLETVERQLVHA